MLPEDKPHWPSEPDPEDVEEKYGEHAGLYAEVRSKTAASMGRNEAAEEWGEVGEEIEAAQGSEDDE